MSVGKKQKAFLISALKSTRFTIGLHSLCFFQSVCRSVGRSVGRSVNLSVYSLSPFLRNDSFSWPDNAAILFQQLARAREPLYFNYSPLLIIRFFFCGLICSLASFPFSTHLYIRFVCPSVGWSIHQSFHNHFFKP